MDTERAVASEMTLYSSDGEPLYLLPGERERFLAALDEEDPVERMFCHLLYYTGCRPTEARELVLKGVLIEQGCIELRSLKKRKTNSKGKIKPAQFRTVPVPPVFIEHLDLVFDVRARQKNKKNQDTPLWVMSRTVAWRLVKRVMTRAGITGKRATAKGLRHGFGVAMVSGKNPLILPLLAQIMGHSSTKTTEIYLQFVGKEKHSLVMKAWE